MTTSVLVRASNTGSAAGDGGTIEVEGEDLVLGGNLFAQGASATGGEVALSASGNLQIGGEINILSWGNYIDFALPDFEKAYGVKVNIDYYADEQEAMNKIRAAGTGTHDIVFLGAGFEDIAIKQQLIQPLDEAHQFAALPRRHSSGGLVHQQQLGCIGQRDSELDTLQVAIGQHAANPLGLVRHVDFVQ